MDQNYATKFIGESVTVSIDRPMGSKHPKFDFTYPVNYGEILGTLAPDGEAVDAYVLGVSDPIEEFTGECIAVIHRTNDNDDKLVVVPKGKLCTDSDIMALVTFQKQFFESVIIREKLH